MYSKKKPHTETQNNTYLRFPSHKIQKQATQIIKTPREEWTGWEGGGRFSKKGTDTHPGLTHADRRQRPTYNCRAIILQLEDK